MLRFQYACLVFVAAQTYLEIGLCERLLIRACEEKDEIDKAKKWTANKRLAMCIAPFGFVPRMLLPLPVSNLKPESLYCL